MYQDFFKALDKSLDVTLQHPSCASPMWLQEPDLRFSRLSATPSDDNSLYWVDESNKILCLAFPAILEKKELNVSSLHDIKTIFQLLPLSNISPSTIRREAQECSALAMTILQVIYNTLERKIEHHLHLSELTTSNPFHLTDNLSRQSKFIVKTEPLFTTHPNPLEGMKAQNFFHGCNVNNSNLIEVNHQSEDIQRRIQNMRDHDRRFSCFCNSILTQTTHEDCFITIPNIRDADGQIIMPNEYDTRLSDGSIVIVNVYPRLEVSENDDRDYQTILNSMQCLPVTDIFQITGF